MNEHQRPTNPPSHLIIMQIDYGDVAFQSHNFLVVLEVFSTADLPDHPLLCLRIVLLHGIDEPLGEIGAPSDVITATAPLETTPWGLLRGSSAGTVVKSAVGASTCHSVGETGSAHGVYVGLFSGR